MSNNQQRYPQARKRFGQNFLQDQSVIDGIVAAVAAEKGQHLVEIGPGRGALTAPLLASGAQVDVIELDRDLVPILEHQFAGAGNLTLHAADALQFNYRDLHHDTRPLRIIGNLPYNITTPLLFHLLTQSDVIEDMCFMLQKEVVERICASPGNKDYGRLSIMLQYQCDAEMLFTVPATAFEPVPKVESAIIYLQPKALPAMAAVDSAQLSSLVTKAFSQRRKTIANTLKNSVSAEQLKAVEIDPKQRPETITVDQFVALAQLMAVAKAK